LMGSLNWRRAMATLDSCFCSAVVAPQVRPGDRVHMVGKTVVPRKMAVLDVTQLIKLSTRRPLTIVFERFRSPDAARSLKSEAPVIAPGPFGALNLGGGGGGGGKEIIRLSGSDVACVECDLACDRAMIDENERTSHILFRTQVRGLTKGCERASVQTCCQCALFCCSASELTLSCTSLSKCPCSRPLQRLRSHSWSWA